MTDAEFMLKYVAEERQAYEPVVWPTKHAELDALEALAKLPCLYGVTGDGCDCGKCEALRKFREAMDR